MKFYNKLLCAVPVLFTYFLYNAGFNSLLSNEAQSKGKIVNKYDTAYSETSLDGSLSHKPQDLTDMFYNVVTDFYEYGWGQSFHFAARYKGESLAASIVRHEHFISSKLQLNPEKSAIDLGSGIGGPMRSIVKFSGANITGVSINDYQIGRCKALNARELSGDLASKVRCVQSDFAKLDAFGDETFDAAYGIESFCHLVPRAGVFNEAFRVLKPGGLLSGYEWLMTDKFDPKNEAHLHIKRGVEHGNGLPDLITIQDALDSLQEAGFEVIEHFDLNAASKSKFGDMNVPWYVPLQAGYSLENFHGTWLGRTITQVMLNVLETLRIAPAGSVATATMLEDGASSLVLAGEQEIMTPMYFVLARKPKVV